MILPERMKKIVQQVSENSIVADIGTDHGLIPKYLLEKRRIKYAIASDVSGGSLEKARMLFKMSGLDCKTDCREGYGLSVLKPYEADEIVIAGMGGILIAEIIKRGMEVVFSCHSLILQPNTACPELRSFLNENGIGIFDECLVEERGKFYEIMVVRPEPSPISFENFYISGYWKRDEVFYSYIRKKLKKTDIALCGMKSSKNPNEERILELEKIKDILMKNLASV